MLVLTRRVGEAPLLRIGETTFWVSLEDINSNQARIGIDAPADEEIIREELLEQIDVPSLSSTS